MKIIEIRDLDGPNLFALYPVIKLEVVVDALDYEIPRTHAQMLSHRGVGTAKSPIDTVIEIINVLHREAELPIPNVMVHALDIQPHQAICFRWEWRTASVAISQSAVDILNGAPFDNAIAGIRQALEHDHQNSDRPQWVTDDERKIPTIAITGTNGKTTTTRLLAHIARTAGYSVGWSSSSGVYINGDMVLEGDFTGPSGARRVLLDENVQIGILETARGGILLRGLGYESNDISIFLNVSPDHLHLHGVTNVETLARVKSTVVRTTRPGGTVVLNADDPLVSALQTDVRASIFLFSQNANNPDIVAHVERGGMAIARNGRELVFSSDGDEMHLVDLSEVPLTFGGTATHMVENVMAASAAAISQGIDLAVLRQALHTFAPDPEHNAGRLNVFEYNGAYIVVDFAHNERGLETLIAFGRAYFPEDSSLTAIIGTAGDRTDDVFVGLGRIAGERADRIILKKNPKYLRGREPDEVLDLMRQGVKQANAEVKMNGIAESERDATSKALDAASAGDVIVMMCVEDTQKIIGDLINRGARYFIPEE